jgi:hypothetical protein
MVACVAALVASALALELLAAFGWRAIEDFGGSLRQTWLAVGGLLGVVALVANWLPARHAARVNPATTLKD